VKCRNYKKKLKIQIPKEISIVFKNKLHSGQPWFMPVILLVGRLRSRGL
jgi:hypothetical protein